MRLIDADWLLEHVKPYELSDEDWSVTGGTAIRLIHNAINQAPTIDAVPVVRCKDCKFGTHFGDMEDEWIRCMNLHGNPLMPFDGFCSYGERKEGAE